MDDIAYEYHSGLIAQPNCKGCPLEGSKIVPPEGNPRARIALVGECASYVDTQEGKPLVGQQGQLLNRLLARAGIDRRECWVTHAVMCKAKTVVIDGKPVAPENSIKIAAKFCKSRLNQELAIIKPRVIVALGTIALKSVYGQNASMKDRRGSIHTIDLLKTTTDLAEEEAEDEDEDVAVDPAVEQG